MERLNRRQFRGSFILFLSMRCIYVTFILHGDYSFGVPAQHAMLDFAKRITSHLPLSFLPLDVEARSASMRDAREVRS